MLQVSINFWNEKKSCPKKDRDSFAFFFDELSMDSQVEHYWLYNNTTYLYKNAYQEEGFKNEQSLPYCLLLYSKSCWDCNDIISDILNNKSNIV
jgi:hypothetical protein